MTAATQRSFVVTIAAGNAAQSQVWDSSRPLPLGRPFRWVLESGREGQGLRVRGLASPLDRLAASEIHELSEEMIARGASVELSSLKIEVRPVRHLPSAVKPQGKPSSTSVLRVSECVGGWLREAKPLGETYVATLEDKEVFRVSRGSEACLVTSAQAGVRVEGGRDLPVGEPVTVPFTKFRQSTVVFGSFKWVFSAVDAPEIPAISDSAKNVDPTDKRFHEMLKWSGVAACALTLIALVWPQSRKQDEIIPAQFAKIVLEQPAPNKGGASKASGTPARTAASAGASKKAPKAATNQALHSQSLQSSMSSLLRGGMTKLMNQSAFVAGQDSSANARKIFTGAPVGLVATSPDAGLGSGRNVKVASLGGGFGASGGAGANNRGGVGYGKGDHASVGGQGHSYVKLDTTLADVEEGLTKEEVGAVIHSHLSEVRYCYEDAMLRSPDVEGKLMMAFTIGAPGSVNDASVRSSTLRDPRLDDCILRRLVTWKFPRTKGGIDVSVTYPFIFKTLGK